MQSDPVKCFVLLLLEQEEADSREEWNVEQVSLLLTMNPNHILQDPFWLRSY